MKFCDGFCHILRPLISTSFQRGTARIRIHCEHGALVEELPRWSRSISGHREDHHSTRNRPPRPPVHLERRHPRHGSLRIDHLIIDKFSGPVTYAVISFGGFMGLGHSHYSVPLDTHCAAQP